MKEELTAKDLYLMDMGTEREIYPTKKHTIPVPEERKIIMATGKMGIIEFEKAVWRRVHGEEMPQERLDKLMEETPEGRYIIDQEGVHYEG